jgi:hypothetical protein
MVVEVLFYQSSAGFASPAARSGTPIAGNVTGSRLGALLGERRLAGVNELVVPPAVELHRVVRVEDLPRLDQRGSLWLKPFGRSAALRAGLRLKVPFGRSAALRAGLRLKVPFGRSAALRAGLRSSAARLGVGRRLGGHQDGRPLRSAGLVMAPA